MNLHTLEELKELIAAKLSLEEILDILGWDIPDLLEAVEDSIEEEQSAFEKAVR